MIHRNYYIASQIRLFIFDDRVEIISPGTLPNTLTVDSIKVGIHIERNPVLASFIRDIDGVPYYGVGTGIKRILNYCGDEGIKVEFINQKDEMQFKVIFWRNRANEQASEQF